MIGGFSHFDFARHPAAVADRARLAEVVSKLLPDGEKVSKLLPDGEKDAVDAVKTYFINLNNSLSSLGTGVDGLQIFSSFLPPRLVEACRQGSLVPFFGSGISRVAGIPTWTALLNALQLPADYLTDPYAENDPLTQAELIAQTIGNDELQRRLRDSMGLAPTPSLAHYLLASLQLPVYVTTNYDGLFEAAWKKLELPSKLVKLTTDLNVDEHGLEASRVLSVDAKTLLIKIHGCADEQHQQLILTRSDYRRHYRSNPKLFRLVKDILGSACVLFLGFGHRDPEVSRLVEDVVYEYEREPDGRRPPTLYSIQFDMRQRTPEVFAARGIVALRPPVFVNNNALQEMAVSIELGELLAAATANVHSQLNLQTLLIEYEKKLAEDLGSAMGKLRARKADVNSTLGNTGRLKDLLGILVGELGTLAGQGVYVTDPAGKILALAVPKGLDEDARFSQMSFGDRPYFRQARTFRNDFVSDVLKSIYNDNSTLFLCAPLGSPAFTGLLFAAAQPGAWELPLELRGQCPPGVELILVDSRSPDIEGARIVRFRVSGVPQWRSGGEVGFPGSGRWRG